LLHSSLLKTNFVPKFKTPRCLKCFLTNTSINLRLTPLLIIKILLFWLLNFWVITKTKIHNSIIHNQHVEQRMKTVVPHFPVLPWVSHSLSLLRSHSHFHLLSLTDSLPHLSSLLSPLTIHRQTRLCKSPVFLLTESEVRVIQRLCCAGVCVHTPWVASNSFTSTDDTSVSICIKVSVLKVLEDDKNSEVLEAYVWIFDKGWVLNWG